MNRSACLLILALTTSTAAGEEPKLPPETHVLEGSTRKADDASKQKEIARRVRQWVDSVVRVEMLPAPLDGPVLTKLTTDALTRSQGKAVWSAGRRGKQLFRLEVDPAPIRAVIWKTIPKPDPAPFGLWVRVKLPEGSPPDLIAKTRTTIEQHLVASLRARGFNATVGPPNARKATSLEAFMKAAKVQHAFAPEVEIAETTRRFSRRGPTKPYLTFKAKGPIKSSHKPLNLFAHLETTNQPPTANSFPRIYLRAVDGARAPAVLRLAADLGNRLALKLLMAGLRLSWPTQASGGFKARQNEYTLRFVGAKTQEEEFKITYVLEETGKVLDLQPDVGPDGKVVWVFASPAKDVTALLQQALTKAKRKGTITSKGTAFTVTLTPK